MGHSDAGLKFSIIIDLQIFKTLFVQSFKKYVKNTYFGPKKLLFQIFPYIQRAVILISEGLTSQYSLIYILHLEMNSGNLC